MLLHGTVKPCVFLASSVGEIVVKYPALFIDPNLRLTLKSFSGHDSLGNMIRVEPLGKIRIMRQFRVAHRLEWVRGQQFHGGPG